MTLQMNRKSGLSRLDTRCQKGDEIDLKDRKKMRNKAVNIMFKKIQVASLDLDDGQYMNIHKPVLSAFITPFESSEGISTVIKVTEQDFDQYGILHFSNAVKPLSLNQWKGDEPALNQDTVEATVCNNKADERDLKLPTIELEINGTLSIKEEDIDGKLATHVEDMNGTSSVDREYINGQLATNIEDMNGTSAADLGDRNGKSATYREDINGTSAADVGDMNGQLATHVEDMNGTSSVDREYINGQLATNMEYMKGTSSANIENINGKLTTNIEDMNGTSAADVGDRNGKSATYREDINGTSAADIGDMNGKLATNVEDMNETSSLDVENINGKSATNTEDMNGTSSRDIEYLNGILATNVEDMNGTSSVDIKDISGKLAMKEKSSGDVEDINRKFATNIEDMNGTLADEVGDMNGKLATNIEDMKGTSAADVGDMNGKLATKIEDMNGTSAADVGDMNGTSSADIEYINEKSATNIEEMNGTSAAHGEMNGKLATSVEDMKGTSSTDIEYIYGKFSSKVELEKRFKKQDGNCKLVGSDFFNQLSGMIRLSAHRHQSGKYNEEIEQQQIFNLNCNSRVRFLSSSQHKQHGQLAGTAQASWSIRIVISILLIGVLFTHVHAEDGEINRKAVYWKVKMDAVRYGEDLLLGCIDVNKETNNNTCKWNRRLKTGESASEILTWDNYSYNYSKLRRVNTCDLLVFALTPEDTELYDYYCTINTTSSSVKSILDGNAVVIPSEKNIVIFESRIEVDSRCSQDLIFTLKINGEVKEEVECKTVGPLSEINISYNFTKSDLGKPMALTAKKFNTTFLVYNGTVPSNYKVYWKVKMDAVRYGEDLLLGCIDVNKETNNNTCKWNRRLKTGESASEILTWDNYSYNYSKFRRVNTCDLLVFALTPEDTELYDYYCIINTTSSSVKSILDGNAVVIPSKKNIVVLENRIEVASRCSQDLIFTLKINGEVKEEVECKTVGQLSEINISYNFTKSDLGKPMALTAKKFNTTFLVYNGTVPSNYKAHVRTEDNTYSAIVGAVGGGIAVLVVAAVIKCGWWCYKRKKKMKEQRSMDVPFKEHFLSEKKEEHGNNQRNV